MAPTDHDRLSTMRAFAAVGRQLSFVKAARALDIGPSALSRRVARLEASLGCRLLNRTTRQVTLTEAGELYLDRCLDVLTRLQEAEAAVSTHAQKPRGLLRVSLPNLYGQKIVAPLMPAFMARFPEVRLQLMFDDRFVDLTGQRIDVGLRIGALTQGDYVVRRIAENPRHLCASPDYLARRGAPRGIADLSDHDCLHFSPLLEGATWRFALGGRASEVAIEPALQADNAEALRIAALAGRGIALLADFVVGEDLAAGRLVKLLPEWTVAESAVYLVYPNARHMPTKTRAFVDFLVAEIRS